MPPVKSHSKATPPVKPARTTVRRGPRSRPDPWPKSADKEAQEPEPLIPEPEPDPEPVQVEIEDGRPQDHKGIPVVREELFSNLPSGAAFRISKLHLADGSACFSCRDCLFTADVRAEVQHHRNAEHGARFGKRAPKVDFEEDDNLTDLILPPRSDGTAAPSDPMQWTLAEFLSLVPSLGATGDLIEQLERERDAALAELAERRRQDRENAHKINVYESLQDEVVTLRMMTRGTGSYEDMKNELRSLQAWKRNVIKKFEALGFKLPEEDS